MKNALFLLFFLCATTVSASILSTTYNPYTGKLDYVMKYNSTDWGTGGNSSFNQALTDSLYCPLSAVSNAGGWTNTSTTTTTNLNVGIGTTSPTQKLDVNGSVNISGISDPTLYVGNGSTGTIRVGQGGFGTIYVGDDYLQKQSGSLWRITGINTGTGSAAVVALSFGTLNTGLFGNATSIAASIGGVEKLRISPTGYLGVGTTNPTKTLDVNGSTNISGQLFVNSGGTQGILLTSGASGTYTRMTLGRATTTDGMEIAVAGGSGQFQNGAVAGDATLRLPSATNTSKLFISSNSGLGLPTTFYNGLVGINTITPVNTLSVNGTVNVSSQLIVDSAAIGGYDSNNFTLVDAENMNNLTIVTGPALFSNGIYTTTAGGYLANSKSNILSFLNASSGYSMSAIARWNSSELISTNGRVVFYMQPNTTGYPYTSIVYRNTSTPAINFRIQYNTTNCDYSASYVNASLQTDGLQHTLTGIFNGTNVLLYVDNIYRGTNGNVMSSECSLLLKNTTFYNMTMRISQSSTSNFSGSIANVLLWNTTLVNDSISTVYNNLSVNCSNLIAWYPFASTTKSACGYHTFMSTKDETGKIWWLGINTTGGIGTI